MLDGAQHGKISFLLDLNGLILKYVDGIAVVFQMDWCQSVSRRKVLS